jgi:hypothetical protein
MDGAHTVRQGDSTPCKIMDRKPAQTDCLILLNWIKKKKKDKNVDWINLVQDRDKCWCLCT